MLKAVKENKGHCYFSNYDVRTMFRMVTVEFATIFVYVGILRGVLCLL